MKCIKDWLQKRGTKQSPSSSPRDSFDATKYKFELSDNSREEWEWLIEQYKEVNKILLQLPPSTWTTFSSYLILATTFSVVNLWSILTSYVPVFLVAGFFEIFMSVVWFIVTRRGWRNFSRWTKMAKEIEQIGEAVLGRGDSTKTSYKLWTRGDLLMDNFEKRFKVHGINQIIPFAFVGFWVILLLLAAFKVIPISP